jgi:hypothetical protein
MINRSLVSLTALVGLLLVACSSTTIIQRGGEGADGGGADDMGSAAGLTDCPPCWKEWFCGIPPTFQDSVYFTATPQADGSCTLTSARDAGGSLTIPLQCASSATPTPKVPWRVKDSGSTVTFSIPNMGAVECDET